MLLSSARLWLPATASSPAFLHAFCAPLRASPDDVLLETAIRVAISRKPKGHDFDYSRAAVKGQMSRTMSHTGG